MKNLNRHHVPWSKWAIIVLLFLVLLAGQSWITYRLFTSQYPGGNDFFHRWSNACALVWTGENPYSDEVTLQTQIALYGRPAIVGEEDLAAFSYPLYAFFFFWPLCFIQPYTLVQAIWMTLMLYTLLGGIFLTRRVARWRPPAWLWLTTFAWGALNYPHARALLLGQMATIVFLCMILAVWALEREHDLLAGVMLALITIKPQMSFLFIPWLLLWTALQRRWRVWIGFGAAMGVLAGLSFVLVPTWVTDFIRGVGRYNLVAATARRSLTSILVRDFLSLGETLTTVVTIILALYGLWEAWRMRRANWDGFLWMTGLVLILTHYIAPRAATTHYSMMLLPLFAWFKRLQEKHQRGASIVVGIEAALFAGQWIVFFTTVQGNYEGTLAYLPFPILMLVVHLLSRREIIGREA